MARPDRFSAGKSIANAVSPIGVLAIVIGILTLAGSALTGLALPNVVIGLSSALSGLVLLLLGQVSVAIFSVANDVDLALRANEL